MHDLSFEMDFSNGITFTETHIRDLQRSALRIAPDQYAHLVELHQQRAGELARALYDAIDAQHRARTTHPNRFSESRFARKATAFALSE